MALNKRNDCTLNCVEPFVLNINKCECECPSEGCTNQNHVLNSNCECECPVGSSTPCSGGQVLLADNCECGCEQQTCTDDAKTLNSDTCECECTNITNCDGNETFDHDSCTCECPYYTSGNCPGNQVLLIDNCQCGCRELEDNSNICDVDGQQWDSTNCQCKCTNVTECDGNETFDHDSCTCECPVGSSAPCSGGQVLLVDNCECGCSQSNPNCIDGETWDNDLCSCTLKNQDILKGQTEFNLSGGDEYLNGTLTISDEAGSESHSIIQLGSLIISAPGATRNFSDATISASPASASSQSDPHIKTFFGKSFEL